MDDRYLLTPFFLDQPLEGLLPLVQDDWHIVKPELPDGNGEARADMARMAVLYEALAEEVAAAVSNGERPVSIAGDCCTTIGVLAGLQRAGLDPTVLWLDAHGDLSP